MYPSESSVFTKKNLGSLLVLAVLVFAIPFGVNLIREQQRLRSHAGGGILSFTNADGSPITETKDNLPLVHDLTVGVRVVAPVVENPTANPTTNPTSNPTAPPGTTFGSNILRADMQNKSFDGTPKGANQFFGPGQYRLQGSVSWTAVFPPQSGFQELATLQVDVYTEGDQYCTTYGPERTLSVIDGPNGNTSHARSYTLDKSFSIPPVDRPDCTKFAVIERASNTKATFANVSLTKSDEVSTNLVAQTSGSETNATSDYKGVSLGILGRDNQNEVLGRSFVLRGSSSSPQNFAFDVAEWKLDGTYVGGSPAGGGHKIGEVFTLQPGNFLQVGVRLDPGASISWSNIQLMEVRPGSNVLREAMRNATYDGTPAGTAEFYGSGTYKLTGNVSWTPVFPAGSGFQELSSLQVDIYTEGNQYCDTIGAGDQTVIHLPQPGTSYPRSFTLDKTFTIPLSGRPDCTKFAVVERAINTKAQFSNTSLQKAQ
jgi:hypothetical protein